MTALDQAKLTVAQRMIAVQHREIAGLQIREQLAQRRAQVVTIVTGPLAPFLIMGFVYALYCGLDLWLAHRKKGNSNAVGS